MGFDPYALSSVRKGLTCSGDCFKQIVILLRDIVLHKANWKYFVTPLAFRFAFVIADLSNQASTLLFTQT